MGIVHFVCLVMHVIVNVSVWEGFWYRHADVVCSCHVQSVQALKAAFCMTCSLLMLVGDAISDHMDEAYSRVGIMTAYMWPQESPFVYPMLYL